MGFGPMRFALGHTEFNSRHGTYYPATTGKA
jgi:hypothetical protein